MANNTTRHLLGDTDYMENDSYGCNLSAKQEHVADQLQFAIYHVFDFIYLTFGLTGNIILLVAFWKQSKKQCAYLYQVYFTVSKTLEIFWFGTFLLAYYWLGSSFIGVQWFTESFFLMYTLKVLGFGIHYALMISSLLLAVAMAADRVFAIVRPLLHNSINHKRHQISAAVISSLLGLLGGGLYFYSMGIRWDPDAQRYIAELDEALYHSPLGVALFYIGISIRLAGVVALIVLYLIMVIAFKKHMKRVGSILRINSKNAEEQKRRRCAECTLLWLNIYQAVMMLFNQVPHVLWHFLYYMEPFSYHYCSGRIIGTLCDFSVLLTDTLDFFVVLAVNKRMRRLILNVIPGRCKKECDKSA